MAGFDAAIAGELAQKKGVEEIKQQIDWLSQRHPNRNRLGMLRKAIEENWPSPIDVTPDSGHRRTKRSKRLPDVTTPTNRAAEQRRGQREARLRQWQQLTTDEKSRLHQQAIDNAVSATVRRRLRSHDDLDRPPTETLQLIELQSAAN